MPRRSLTFLFDPKWPDVGSTVMRGLQVSEFARAELGRRWRVRYLPLGSRVHGSAVFLTKNAAAVIGHERAAELVARGCRLYIDIVDSAPPAWASDVPCVIVTASLTSLTKVSRTHPHREVVFLTHQADPRVPAPPASRDTFRIGYFGEVFNARLTLAIESEVEIVPVATATQTVAWFDRLPEFAMHYAIRRRIEQDDVKPFMKGFTAAASHANILASRTDPEAVAWLGEDYPYLIDGEHEEDILAMIERARSDFGTTRWNDALTVMDGIRERVAPLRVVHDLERIIAV